MNGISSIRLDTNAARHSTAAPRKKVDSVDALKTVVESEKKKQFKTELNNEFNSRKNPTKNNRTELLLSDQKYYRANLLSEIVNKMSGAEVNTSPGHYVEYYA